MTTELPVLLVCERAERLARDAGFSLSFRPSREAGWPIIASVGVGDQRVELGRFEQDPLEDQSLEKQSAVLANQAIALLVERREAL